MYFCNVQNRSRKQKSFCIYMILMDHKKWWRARNLEGQIGHVPHTIVTPAQGLTDSPQVSPKSAEWVQKERRGKKGEFRYF